MFKEFLKDKAPGVLNTLAGFALETAQQVRSAVHDKALQTAQQLDLADRSELEALKKRVADLEQKLAEKTNT